MDSQERLAQQAVALSDMIADSLLARGAGATPLQYILNRAKNDSTKALGALLNIDPTEVETVRVLQFEAQLYSRMVGYIRQAFEYGLEQDGAFAGVPYADAMELYHDVMAPQPEDEIQAGGI